ncbi:MAG TPA: hypothetical protein VGQ41_15765 [Pyrinomonadaceae bacterium]|jgi:hypothetical protein|nr:hypothetical protein [Pyrinomonadaceae bacterium]
MRKRRAISKAKTYGFNPWMDQIDTINQIMKETGETRESVLLRKLVDEALAARRKKSQSLPLIDESENEQGDRLQTIESALMRLVRQATTSLRIQDVCLALLQDVLAEAHATHRMSWDFVAAPRLRDDGIDVNEVEQRFKLQADQAKNYAYGVAARIKKSQESAK